MQSPNYTSPGGATDPLRLSLRMPAANLPKPRPSSPVTLLPTDLPPPHQKTPGTSPTGFPSHRKPQTSPPSPPHTHSSKAKRSQTPHPCSRRNNTNETSPIFSCPRCNSAPPV